MKVFSADPGDACYYSESDAVDIPDTNELWIITTAFEIKSYQNAINAITSVPSGTYVGNARINLASSDNGKIFIPFVLQSSWEANIIEVKAPAGLVITTTGGVWFTGIINRPETFTGTIQWLSNTLSVVSFGNNKNAPLYFKNTVGDPLYVQLRIPVPWWVVGELVSIHSSQNWSDWTIPTTTKLIDIDGTPYAFFPTNHATIFAIVGWGTGEFVINNDDTTTSQTVTLNMAFTPTDPQQMRFSNNGVDWSSWMSYATSTGWTLSAGYWTKTVFAQFDMDGDGTGDVQTYDDILYPSLSQGQLWLELSSLSGSCTYGTSIDLGAHAVQFNAFSITGNNFKNGWSDQVFQCIDTQGNTSWTMTLQAATPLTWSNGQTIAASNVLMQANANQVTNGLCTTWTNATDWIAIDSAGTILNKAGNQNDICTITSDRVNLAIQIPANQAVGVYTGELVLTMPF